jgi:nitrate/TMAO reductase-like tetraheme cytochrome c subunit
MKNLEFYEEYIQYLNWRLESGEISKGKLSLLKISKSEYDKFIDKLETNEKFNKKIISIITREKRDKIITDVISDNEIDDFFDDFDL